MGNLGRHSRRARPHGHAALPAAALRRVRLELVARVAPVGIRRPFPLGRAPAAAERGGGQRRAVLAAERAYRKSAPDDRVSEPRGAGAAMDDDRESRAWTVDESVSANEENELATIRVRTMYG